MFVQHTRESQSYYCFRHCIPVLIIGTNKCRLVYVVLVPQLFEIDLLRKYEQQQLIFLCKKNVLSTHFANSQQYCFQDCIRYRTRSITAFRYRIPALQEQMLSRMSYSSRSKLKLVDLLSWYYGSSNMISFRNWIARTKIL